METPQPPQVSVSGRIVIEGQLPASSGANSENAPAPSSPPWWKFWKPAPSEFALPRATVWLVIATFILAAIALGQACILLTTDASTRKAANAADTSARTLETALQTVRDNLPPNQEGDDFNTILSKATISQDDYNTLLKIDNAIIISGRITYEDAYGNKYETQFCLGKLAGGPNAHCKEGNDIK